MKSCNSIWRHRQAQAPLLGAAIKATQAILVDRYDPDSRKKTIATLKSRARSHGHWRAAEAAAAAGGAAVAAAGAVELEGISLARVTM